MRYNDVAQGRNNKTVRIDDDRKTRSDIERSIVCGMVESDDPTPDERLTTNTPGWENGDYQPGCDDGIAETFAATFNDEESMHEEPTHEQLMEIDVD